MLASRRVAASLALDEDGPTRRKFLARLHGETSKRGTIEVLRHGVKHGAHDIDLFYGAPSAGNPEARDRFERNRFTVVRQLRYSRDDTQRALDIGLFINGLPVFTFELKNGLTKQTAADAVEQYKKDRNPREKLFEPGRCVAHFAVDESEVRFCTHLSGKASRFLPFNRGWNDGAGNPPNPSGIKTDYLWREVLARESVTDILENYAQVVAGKDDKTGRRTRTQIWPRYHQLDVVRRLLADAGARRAGRCYLVQHSAGSGKSNSIAWLAHQLIGLARDDAPVFDSIIVVTDRLILDRQIGDTIRQYAQVGATVGRAQRSGDLRRFIEAGKKIIISTVQKFPFILDEIGNEQRTRRFAIIIDEAHSSQGGRTSASMSVALGAAGEEGEDETFEDRINRVMESRKLLPNASYFAFTATPKNRTLEIFGAPDPQPDGAVQHRAFHGYTMKQAIQEGFILDVLAHYTPVASYYRLAKTVEDDPEFDVRKAQTKLRRFVEGNDHAIRLKAEIMVDHFHEQVLAKNKVGGAARAMVVTGGIERAIRYFHAIRDYLQARKSPYRAVVAFSGEPRVRRPEGDRGVAERLPGRPDRREDPGGPVPLPRVRRQVPDRLRRAPAAHDVRRQGLVRHQGRTDAVAPEPLACEEARRLRARLPERRRHHPRRLRRLLPRDDPGRRDRPRQAPRPAGGSRRRPGLRAGAGRRPRRALPRRGRARRARSDPRRLRGGLRARAGRGRAGGLQGQGQGVRADLRLPVLRPALHERRVGEALDLPQLPDPQAPGPRGAGPLQGHP